jgi:hypothetical protein
LDVLLHFCCIKLTLIAAGAIVSLLPLKYCLGAPIVLSPKKQAKHAGLVPLIHWIWAESRVRVSQGVRACRRLAGI